MLSVRIRLPKGQEVFKLDPASTFESLAIEIKNKSGIDPTSQRYLTGFPPKEIVTSPTDSVSKHLKSGDTVIVEAKPSPSPTQEINIEHLSLSTPPPVVVASSLPSTVSGGGRGGVGIGVASRQQSPPPPSAVVGEQDESVVVRRQIPDDNSCLFNAVGYVLEGQSLAHASRLRKVIADAVSKDPITFNEGFLGKSPSDYAHWIQLPGSWGGAIELFILAQHYRTEIMAFDVISLRKDTYGDGNGYPQRVLLMYDGIHYDALALSPFQGAPEYADQTIFSPPATAPVDKAFSLISSLHAAGKYTDTATFSIMCLQCKTVLKGEDGALKHAKATGHTRFDEAPRGR
mmetsp:Transcript_37250/g.60327  ORF Transcript_37250/g.60327 Transcript_37250/m.60327 type:complete len:345 (-) Transcript_37250:130-1164(-)